MHNTIEPQTETPKRYQCRHIFTDGHRCGSPCLRSEHLCYYHHTTRKPAPHPRTRQARRSTFEIPSPKTDPPSSTPSARSSSASPPTTSTPAAPASSSTASRSPASTSPNLKPPNPNSSKKPPPIPN